VSFGLRLTLAVAAAVAIAVTAASLVVFVAIREQLLQQTDAALAERATSIQRGRWGADVAQRPQPQVIDLPGSRPDMLVQFVAADGGHLRFSDPELPVTDTTRDVASGRAGSFYTDATVEGSHLRILTVPYQFGFALQVARSLDEMDRFLQQMTLTIAAVVVGGVLLAAALGALVARAALRPVHRLTGAVEDVARTRDLSRPVPEGGRDELGRLAASFNSMLAALDTALRSQRQLVADASHELRTPITSLRTNIELLQRGEPADPEERRRVLDDAVGQLGRRGHHVAELIDLAREEESPPLPAEEVPLDDVVRGVIASAAQHWPNTEFALDAEPSVVRGDPERIERAVRNLIDNAAKWTPPGTVVEVSVRSGEVAVRDHGPGVAESDAPHVFDRFWRAPGARSLPGSGLGLAIVKEVARAHGGSVSVERAPTGGALFRLRFPAPGRSLAAAT
jgi:two-component system sensor histidine kinase MprB